MIQFVKSGCVLREFPTEFYSIAWMNHNVVVLSKVDRSPVFFPSPNYYDYIEVIQNDD